MSVEKQHHLDSLEALAEGRDTTSLGTIPKDQEAIRQQVFGVQDISRLSDSDPALGGFWSFTDEELKAMDLE